MALRNFLYLDTVALYDYLASLEGYMVEGSMDQTQIEKTDKSGKAGYMVLEGTVAAEKSTELKKKLAVTDAAKFQNLYGLLEEQNLITSLDAFDMEIWKNVSRGDILEVEANIRLPAAYNLTKTVEDVKPFLGLLESFSDEVVLDDKSRNAIEGISAVTKLSSGKPVPIVFEAVSTPGFKFTGNIAQKFLRVDTSELEDQATVFGKVKRIISKGEQLEVFSLFPAFTSSLSLPSLRKDQKRQMQKNMVKSNMAEVVKGPAIVLMPLAIYR